MDPSKTKIAVTPVYLTAEEAIRFIEFQKHYAFMKLMDGIRAFDIRSGSVTINFDSLGKISSIDKKEHFKAE